MKKVLFFFVLGLLLLARNGPVFAAPPDDAACVTVCQDMDAPQMMMAAEAVSYVHAPQPAEWCLPYGITPYFTGISSNSINVLPILSGIDLRASCYDEIICYRLWQLNPQNFSAATGNI